MKKASLIWLRRIVALIVFALFFMALGMGFLPLASLAHYQIGPALLAGNIIFLLIIAILTLCLGRVYCACLCPLGISQDMLGHFHKKSFQKALPRHFAPRIAILILFVAALFGGFLTIYGLLDPYSTFGRICVTLLAPVITLINNIFAAGTEAMGIQGFENLQIRFPGWLIFFSAFIALMLLLFLVWRFGRAWCNYCPIGTALGLLSLKSLFQIQLNPEKCVGCKRCEKNCKTGCIDIENRKIDNDRCVICQICVNECPKDAIKYGKII